MQSLEKVLEGAALFSDLDAKGLLYLAGLAERRAFASGEWLFHESTPRQWVGIVERGEVGLMRGLPGKTAGLGVVRTGGILCEGLMLDDLPHSASAFTRKDSWVVQLSKTVVERVRVDRPDIFCRVAARADRIIGERLRCAAD